MRNVAAAFAFVVALAAVTQAAEIHKTDGTVIEGEIVSESESSITVRMRLGEVTIPRSEIATIERDAPASSEHELILLRDQTLERLQALAREADAAGRGKDAQALREIIHEVERWTLTRQESGEGAERPAPPRVQPPPKPLDFARVRARIASLQADSRSTDAVVGAYLDEVHNQPGRGRVEVLESKTGYKGALIMTCKLDSFKVNVTFSDPDQIERALRIRKGSSILVEGTIRTRGIPIDLVADLIDARLR